MSLALLFPMALAALAAVLVPLLLHLARREQQISTDFAALRWLSAKLRPQQKLRFEEWLLLATRIALITALVLLLARPMLTGAGGDAPWLLVVPGADPTAANDLPEGMQAHWLAPGFPPLAAPMPTDAIATASLLREIDASLPAATPIAVLVPAQLGGADGARPRLSRALDWRVVAGAVAGSATPPAANPAFRLAIRHADGDAMGLRHLHAAAAALSPSVDDASLPTPPADIAGIDQPWPDRDAVLAWLAPGDIPGALRRWVNDGGRLLLPDTATWPLPDAGVPAWRDHDGRALAQAARLGQGRVVQWLQPMDPQAMPILLEADFPERLKALMQAPPPAPTWADAHSLAPETGGAAFAETPRDLSLPLMWLVLALFALERWLASGRRERAP